MTDKLYMTRCLELAEKGKANARPNPMVGAVLVYNNRIIGEGWHRQYGQAHAEVNCLDSVREEDRAFIPLSTMYVNLEPCAHTGKTPPCATRLIKEQVGKVVIANTDTFASVNGKGISMLNEAGIPTQSGKLLQEGRWLNRRFFCFQEKKRPYIILKWAQTKEGYMAPADRSRFAITGKATQQLVHKWRTEEQAILVGNTTAINDNPALTARLWHGQQPLRIVIGSRLSLPTDSHLVNNEAPTWIFNNDKEQHDGNVRFIKADSARLLQQLTEELFANNILSLIVEGGAATLNSFIAAGLWDEARILTGDSSLNNGIPAPLLNNSIGAFSTDIEADTLQVYTNRHSGFKYIPGMSL